MTAKEIIAKLEDINIYPSNYEDYEEDINSIEDEIQKEITIEIGEMTEVQSERINEYYYITVFFPKHNIYLQAQASYTSHVGVEFYDNYWYEVKKQTKTITVYE